MFSFFSVPPRLMRRVLKKIPRLLFRGIFPSYLSHTPQDVPIILLFFAIDCKREPRASLAPQLEIGFAFQVKLYWRIPLAQGF